MDRCGGRAAAIVAMVLLLSARASGDTRHLHPRGVLIDLIDGDESIRLVKNCGFRAGAAVELVRRVVELRASR
jgi:hypothetical protein